MAINQIVYVADPMCSWCYGFGPELMRTLAGLGDVEITLVLGGLRAGNTQVMDAKLKATLHEHWRHVEQASGLPFSSAAMTQPGFVYDTEPACRAVVTLRELLPARSLDSFHAVQKAFYADGRDVTQGQTLGDIAADTGVPREQFLTHFDAAETRRLTAADFITTQRWGITGFPTVLLQHQGKLHAVTVGYMKSTELLARVQAIRGGELA